jgi:hypothetical protein
MIGGALIGRSPGRSTTLSIQLLLVAVLSFRQEENPNIKRKKMEYPVMDFFIDCLIGV